LTKRSALTRYGAAGAATLAAFGLRAAFAPLLSQRLPFVTFIAACLFAAWLGGTGPGILAAVLGGGLAVWLFRGPVDAFPEMAVSLAGYGFLCLVCVGFVAWIRRNHERFAQSEALHRESLEAALAAKRELEEALRTRLDELSIVNRRKSEFLAALAHELRNPLAPVSNAIEVLERNPDQPTRGRMLAILRHQSARLARVVEDLIDVSRIEQGRVELRVQTLDFAVPVRHALSASEDAARSAQLSLSVELPESPSWVRGDADRLEQVVLNLLQNAIKYTPPEGHVRVSLGEEGGDAVLRVQDDGYGVPPDLLERIFDLFTQAPQPLARTQGGLGIGLSLVRALMTRQGGSVSAASEGPGLGSEFVVRMPRVEEPASKEPQPPPPVDRPAKGLRVLVVEDNGDMRDSMREILEMWGHAAECAADGIEGLAKTLLFRPEAALVDLGLPRLDGFEFARQIRRQEGGAELFLVALSGYAQPADREAARDAGFDRHLVKPPDLSELERLLADEARRRHPSA
jgi:two-component system, sensor histidine kinase